MSSLNMDDRMFYNLNRFLRVLEDSGVGELLNSIDTDDRSRGGRPPVNIYDLFAAVLYGFAFSSGTLRDIETNCRYDLRYICLMNQITPSFKTIGNFINDYIVPYEDVIRYTIKPMNNYETEILQI